MDEHGYEHAKPTKPQKKAQQRVLPRRGIRYLMLRVRQQFLSRFELHTISENGKADQRRTIGSATPLDSIRRLIQRLVIPAKTHGYVSNHMTYKIVCSSRSSSTNTLRYCAFGNGI